MENWYSGSGFALYCTVVTKRELSQKAKLSIYWSVFVPSLIYGHEGWVMRERPKLWIQAVKTGFHGRLAAISFRDKVRNLELSRCSFVLKGAS